MYYLVSVDHNNMAAHHNSMAAHHNNMAAHHNNMAAHLTRTDKRFRQCCISNAVDGTDDDMLWNDCENGIIDTLAGKGELNLTYFLY